MRSTILCLSGAARLVAALALVGAAPLRAHEIPSRVTVLAFAKPEPGRLRVVLRVPLEAMRDVNFPERGLGYLDLRRADPLAREAAQLWVADYIAAFENGERLPAPRLVATRISIPSDRAFTTYESALARTLGAPLDTVVEIPWNQTALDVVLDWPIASQRSALALEPRLARLGVQTTTVLRFITPDGAVRAYQYLGDPGTVQLDPRWHHAAARFVKLGVVHILGGIDHLLFVLCLVIPFRRMRPLILLVTAFTVAHSITLGAAALGIVPDALWFPPLIETLIAASIVYMALENILGARLQRRWLIAFAFGLVHGFGFSFALGESLQFAGSHLATSLFAFNVGVEIGQLLVLAVAVPVLSSALERVPERAGVIVLSALVAHTAWHWMIDRGASLREYRVTLPAFDAALLLSAMRAALVLLVAAGAAWLLAELYRRLSLDGREPEVERS
jgi:hypothetical protein